MPMRFAIVLPVILVLLPACTAPPDETLTTWQTYLGDPTSSQYAALDQINTDNVDRLRVAWVYHTGDAGPDDGTQMQCNPIVVDTVLYATSPRLKVLALHAATGAELWTFDPFAGGDRPEGPGINRGVAYWAAGDDRRILFVAGATLYALDAATGRPITTFGRGGRVDLKAGLGRDVSDLYVTARTPGIVFEDLLILGSSLSEGPATAPGHIRAYDVRTGEQVWIFHTIPHPGEYGYETWPPEAWKTVGGANAWAGMSLDVRRGLVFVPTGSAAYDFYGGNRHGENLFANTLLALDARTGTRRWHFQTVHHDLWDRDLPAPPNLVTVERDGRRIDAVAQITKTGFVFVLDRETGAPLFPVEERPAPPSDLRGEAAWPTQPVPLRPPPFVRQTLAEDDLNDLTTPEGRAALRERFRTLRRGHLFTPPSTEGTLIFPGFDGGGEWGGAAYDPETGWLYVNASEMPWILTMVDVEPRAGQELTSAGKYLYTVSCAGCHGADREGHAGFPPLRDLARRRSEADVRRILERGSGFMPSFRHLSEAQMAALMAFLFDRETGTPGLDPAAIHREAGLLPYAHTGWHRWLTPEGYPAVKPPWGTLSAIDLNRGEIVWQVPLGEVPALAARGLPPTGTENYGGPVVTAGGLVFIAATKDEKIRAFDKRTGTLLWEADLPAGGYATPAIYMAGGRQYVVVAAGGGKMGTKSGDAYVAFALPD
ncbi:MAG: hypothetical protein KatS3mg043_0624 [Rhodothermaceae bacterium]|nr:MAG: hypothetical protein KatS3mg043_0624 [Rhodothermaceae bacterium]